MDANEIKARLRELNELQEQQDDEMSKILEQSSRSGSGLVGELKTRWDRADGLYKGYTTETQALRKRLDDLRDGASINTPGALGGPKARIGRALGKDESFSSLYSDKDHTEELDQYLRAVARDDQETLRELRAQSVGVDSEGGFTAPSVLSATLWDLARDKTVARDAGVSFIPMQGGPGMEFTFAKINQDAAPTWRLENAEIPGNQLVFGTEQMRPKSLALIVKASNEVIQDSNTDFGSVILQTVTQSFAREIDRVIFNGDPDTNANEPRGARNFTGIGETTGVGVPTWSTLSDAALSVRQQNYEPSAFVMSVRDAHTLAEQRIDQGGGAGTGVYLPPPSTIGGIPRPSTNMVPTDLGAGTDESFVLCGDFSQLLVGVRLDLTVRRLTERYAELGQVGWVFSYRMDTALMRPEAIHKIEGVTAA